MSALADIDDFSALTDVVSQTRCVHVICLGLSALDQIWRVDQLFAGRSEKIKAAVYDTLGGGMAANASVAVARLGASVAFWGRAGNDAAGKEMKTAFVQEGVDVENFRLFSDGRSSVSGIIVDNTGERQIANFRGAYPDAADWLPLEAVARASCVLADPRWVNGAEALFREARARGVTTVLDGDMAEAEVFTRLLPLTDHAIFSEPALMSFAGSASDAALATLSPFGCDVIAVTRGEGGVSWYENGRMHRQDAFAVDVVDTTGAGDVFHGAYALAVGVGLDVRAAMMFSAATSAMKCRHAGGRNGIPTINECLAFMRTKR